MRLIMAQALYKIKKHDSSRNYPNETQRAKRLNTVKCKQNISELW